jgi:hypothetical protein
VKALGAGVLHGTEEKTNSDGMNPSASADTPFVGTPITCLLRSTSGGFPIKGVIPTADRKPRLLLKAREVCELLGGIHIRTLSRMEKAGHIRSVKLLRHRMFLNEDVEALVHDLREWRV